MVNYRRGLIRVWIAGSACWVAYWAWKYATACGLGKMGGADAITCNWNGSTEASAWAVISETGPTLTMLADMARMTLAPPALTFIGGVVVYWAISGFRSRAHSR